MENAPVSSNGDAATPGAGTSGFAKKARLYARKVVGFVVMGLALGYLADFTAKRNDEDRPAGLVWGMVHGALMPTTLPALIMGKDVTIYAPHNHGRIYKIGYALGVNVCGLLFFGAVFWNPAGRTAAVTTPQ